MNEFQTHPAPTIEVLIDQAPSSKFENERRAFIALLPRLLTTHHGQYVAIHGGELVDSGPDRLEVALRVLRRLGNVDIYVGHVCETPDSIFRSGVRRELDQGQPG